MPFALAAIMPALVFVYVLTGPHVWYVALAWILVPFAMAALETLLGRAPIAPPPNRSHRWHDAYLYALVALYFANHVLLLRQASLGGFLRMDTVAAFQLFGVHTAFSGIVMGHELVHRRQWYHQLVGRLMCCTLLYEHFSTEHVRGHHVHGVTEQDTATARYGDTFFQFIRRSVPGQWISGFRLEARRIRTSGWKRFQLAQNHVVQGVALQALMLAAIWYAFGPAAVGVFVVQAMAGILYLEAVNYFQHWGLRRAGRAWRDVDSWETDVRFSAFGMFNLGLHADHHMRMVVPYPLLRSYAGSPQLPSGYLGTIILTLFRNKKLRDYMSGELARLRLGPFAATEPAQPYPLLSRNLPAA